VASDLSLPVLEIPSVKAPRKQILSIKPYQQVRRSQNGKMNAAERHDRAEGSPVPENSVLQSHLACLRVSPLFRGLSQAECREVANAAVELQFSHRETIFRQDDPIQSVYVLLSGMVKVTQLSDCGKETILRVDRRGSLIDDLTDPSEVHASSAHAINSCAVLAWDAAAFEHFTRRFPAIHRNATRIMLERLRALEQRFCDVTNKRVPQRLARLLVSLAGDTVRGELSPIGLSREELSQMAGTSLFTVSRLLQSWRDLDILTVDRKTVVVEDLPRLLRIAHAA
jgi:CRP-like cAMP-binding protein